MNDNLLEYLSYDITSIVLFIVAIIIFIIALLIAFRLHNAHKHSAQPNDPAKSTSQPPLSQEERRLIKSFRSVKGIPDNIPIDMETLSEEEKRLIEEYRKNS